MHIRMTIHILTMTPVHLRTMNDEDGDEDEANHGIVSAHHIPAESW